MKLFLRKLYLRFLLLWYELEMKLDSFMERFGVSQIELEKGREEVQQAKQNVKLTRAVKRITKAIYDDNGKLKDFAKQRGFDLASLTKGGGYESAIEEIKVIDIKRRVLDNPLDESGTDDAIVQHTVKNAPRYLLEQKRREYCKQYFKMLKLPDDEQDKKEVKRLYNEIQYLGAEIKRLKENK